MTGKELIQKMRQEKGLKFWSYSDLKDYICDEGVATYIEFSDPQKHQYCVRLDGWFSIDELDAICIALINDKGAMRG